MTDSRTDMLKKWKRAKEELEGPTEPQGSTEELPTKEELVEPLSQKKLAKAYIIRSELLDGELLALVRHSGVKLPTRYRNILCYTFNEMRTLLESGIRDPETLRAVHEVKKFGGMTRIIETEGDGEVVKSG